MIWPFGYGVVMTAMGDTDETKGMLWITACADGFTQNDGVSVEEAWDNFLENGGPHAILSFTDKASVQNIIEQLQDIQDRLPETCDDDG